MALNSIVRPGHVNMQGVHFAMLDGNTSIRILVTRAALQGEGSPLQERAYLARFEAYRDVYETVAR
jgi:Protein of unknown function (DUF1488)